MSMWAIFACNGCNREVIHGCYSGKDGTHSEICCSVCLKRTDHSFVRYVFVDERTDAQRMRERLEIVIGKAQ